MNVGAHTEHGVFLLLRLIFFRGAVIIGVVCFKKFARLRFAGKIWAYVAQPIFFNTGSRGGGVAVFIMVGVTEGGRESYSFVEA